MADRARDSPRHRRNRGDGPRSAAPAREPGSGALTSDSLFLKVAGLRVRVRVPGAEALVELALRFPPGADAQAETSLDAGWALEPTSGGSLFRVRRDRRRGGRPLPLHAAIDRLAFDVQVFLARHAPGRTLFHAGAVGWKGRAILLPGRSFSGKSTLVAALLRAGATYLSDELAIVDDSGSVHPYARPLALRRATGGTERLLPESIHARTARGGIPIAAIALLRYRSGRALDLQRVSRGEAALGLLAHALAARFRPSDSLRAARAATARSASFRGVRGEADDALPSLLALLKE